MGSQFLKKSKVPESVYNNLLINAFGIAVNGSLVKHEMVDGVVDEFVDESGIDTGVSTNEVYDAGDDFYSPSGGGYGSTLFTNSANIYSDITINTPANLLDGVASTLGGDGLHQGMNHYIGYDFGSGNEKTITRFSMTAHNSVPNCCPTAFLFQGSNNNVDWTTLTSQSGLSWSAAENKNFDFSNSTAYRYYRIYYTAVGSGDECKIGDIYAYESVPYDNMTLVSQDTLAENEPLTGRILLVQEDIDAITINTDLKSYISKDGGTTWNEITLEDVGVYGSNNLLAGNVVLENGSGSQTMKYKIETLNNMNCKIKYVGLLWD